MNLLLLSSAVHPRKGDRAVAVAGLPLPVPGSDWALVLLSPSLYPSGGAGRGLLLLRAAAALALVAAALRASQGAPPLVPALAVSAFLLTGFRTRSASTASIGLGALILLADGARTDFGVVALTSGALLLTGPGALSIDSRLFGRRIVRLRGHKPGDMM